jgi:hypothetical protein
MVEVEVGECCKSSVQAHAAKGPEIKDIRLSMPTNIRPLNREQVILEQLRVILKETFS